MPALCPHCSEPITSADARFCPRCGKFLPAAAPDPDPINLALHPAPIPKLGLAVFAAFVLGPTALIAGIVFGIKPLIYLGTAIMVALAILLVLGS